MTETAPDSPIPHIFETMQVTILESGDGRARLRFPFQERFTIPTGQLQGGTFAIMLDMAMAIAADGKLSTAAVQYSLLRPVFGGSLVASAEVVKSGKRIVYAEAEIRDDEGRLVARGNQTAVPV